MASSSSSSSVSSALDSINTSLAELCADHYRHSPFDLPRRFSGFSDRLQLSLTHLTRATPSLDSLPPSVHTALKGIAADLASALETLSFYRTKCKISVLINCLSLCSSLRDRTVAISGWLALLDAAVQDLNLSDLRKKIADLSRDMKQAHFTVSEKEERVHHTLQKEGLATQSKTSKAVESAIIMDLARGLGIDAENHDELSKQITLLKNDVAGSNLASERRILWSLERILNNWAVQRPSFSAWKKGMEFEDDVHIQPFKNFLCPLTKEVMRDPVVLQSSQTYERTAINYWFERCLEDGRDPTCPVTGQVLGSLEVKPNIGLSGAIEEWVNRNVDIVVKISAQHLSKEPPAVDCVEGVLDNVYNISEEYPNCRYRVRNGGILVLIVKMLRNSSKSIGTYLRSKALMVLLSMAKDEESKKIMLQEGITRLAIHSLTGSSERERESAVKLLLEFSSDEACCIKIASEKGALVLLSSMAGNLEHPGLSKLAEEVLRWMEKVEDNVQHLAAAGRFEPLLTRLCEGSDGAKSEMASLVGSMTLTNSSKEQIARRSAKILVEMLSKPEGRAASLQALYNLSSLDDNATILVDSAVLPSLAAILFINQDTSPELKELAAATIANIVSNSGHWELAYADKEGHSMQSELFVHSLLGSLPLASPQCQISILHILYGIASSPQASQSVARHIKSGEGIKTILPFLEHPEVEHRIHAFRLTRLLSERCGEDIANELRLSKRIPLLQDKLLDHQSIDSERSDAACILANLSLTENEVKTLLGVSFVKWTVTTLKSQRQASSGRISRPASNMLEGLLGLLLHITRKPDRQTLGTFKEHSFITIFQDHLIYPSNPRVRQLAALGLKNLSEYGRFLAAAESEPPHPHGFFSYLVFRCGSSSVELPRCPIHNVSCEEDSQLCLLKSNSIKPLIDLLNDEDTSVQIAAAEALSTLVLETSSSFKRAVDQLEDLGVINAVITLFMAVRPGELQERTTWIIEKVLRVENHRHSLNQALVWALVEAFKHGNSNTKRQAQDALTHLKQLSAVSGISSRQSRTRG
ncbi:U-box domain-containing protein 44-like [Malus sylvestris]|uniref:U-box domain-containing protein 44-like n=1 Tax=Malus sylvestris TaxID=3752 RepID=UPI0021ACE006|nr:U-box domain-containing protein 44-like [Malus sylvestris]